MNTRSFAHKNRARWIGLARVIAGMLLISALGVLQLAHVVGSSDALAASAAGARSTHAQFGAFKQTQAMQVADAATAVR